MEKISEMVLGDGAAGRFAPYPDDKPRTRHRPTTQLVNLERI